MKRRDWLLLGVVLLASWCLGVGSVAGKSMTSDEGAHLVGGYSYWKEGDFRLQPENGNWPQRWVASSLILTGVDEDVRSMPGWSQSDVWRVSDAFIYDAGHDADRLLLRGRAMAMLVGIMTALVAFFWARSLFGAAAGWIALVVVAFSPSMLAHGPLTTSDGMATLFFTASIWMMWRVLHRVTVAAVLTSAFCVAGVFLSKFSAPILVPMALILIAARTAVGRSLTFQWRDRQRELSSRGRIFAASLGLLGAHGIAVIAIIWASYHFRYSAVASGASEFLVPWSNLLSDIGWMGDAVAWMRDLHLLPEAYLYGFTQTAYYAQHRVAFFNGQASDVGGWTGFFPYAFVVKETIPVLLLVGWAIVRAVRHRGYEMIPLVALIAVYWAFALASHLNIGYRHLLPTLPATYILIGSLGSTVNWADWRGTLRTSAAGIALAGLVSWHVVATIIAAPNFIAYFNPLDGGPRHAYKHLVDSSLDWGQDLPALKRWLDENASAEVGGKRVFLSYFGTARPSHYGIEAASLPGYPDRRAPAVPPALTGGVYCISATMLQGIYLDAGRTWTPEYQQNYDALQFNIRLFDSTAANPADRARLIQQTGEEFWVRNFSTFEQLRFAKLAAYLRQREPDASAGYSILIYRLSDAQVRDALGQSGPIR